MPVATTTLQSRLNSIQDAGWLLLVILAPLWVNLWGQQPFELAKVMLVRTLVWLLVALVLVERILTQRATQRDVRRGLQANPLIAPVMLLAVVIVVTTITAANWRLSLWGSYARNQGAVTLLTYLLLFCLAVEQFRTDARAWRVITAMVAAGVPLLLFSLVQSFGWNPFDLITDARSPAYATLGRANFVGAYLVILLPLTLALRLMARGPHGRIGWSVLLAVELLGIGLSLARSAWLATLLALGLFALLWWRPKLAQRWRTLAWGSLGIFLLSGPLAVLWLGPRQLDSIAARLNIWQGTWTLIQARPLLGYGADALGLLFPRVYPPELIYLQSDDFWVDRAHNLLLDWGVIAGIPGLLALLLVLTTFAMVVSNALRQPQSSHRRALLIAILAGVTGNITNNLTSFDVTPTATATWLLMGMGIALATPLYPLKHSPRVDVAPLMRAVWQWALISVLLLSVGIAVWQMNLRPLLADIAARAAHRYAQVDDWHNATAAAQQAVIQWPVEPAHYLLLSNLYWQRSVDERDSGLSWLAEAEAAALDARQLRADDALIWLHIAQFYSEAARHFGSDTRVLAEQAYQRVQTLAPNHVPLYILWGRAALEQGDAHQAASLLRQAVALDMSNGTAYIDLGAAEAALGRLEIARADYLEAVRLLPESTQAYLGLADCLWQLDQPHAALQAVEQALQFAPQNVQAIALRQAIYASLEQ